jgi:hypothetical protein
MTGTGFREKLDDEWHEFWSSLPGRHDEPEPRPRLRPPQPSFTPHDVSTPAPSEPPVPSQQGQPEPPAQPEPTQEEPMSQLSDELNALATRLAPIDDDSVTKLEQVKADPDKSRAFDAVAALPAPLSPAASAMVMALEALAQQPQ